MTDNEYREYINKVRDIVSERETPPLALVRSYGCQQNMNDGERFAGMLCSMGFGITYDASEADVILLNTCAVRENAETKVFGNIGELKHLKEKKPSLIIGVCGCMTQQEHIAGKIMDTYRFVDIVFGTFAAKEFPRLLCEVLTGHGRISDISENGGDIPEDTAAVRSCTYKAGVPIMYGCNNFCTYCIVPYVRGRERSRSPEKILGEVKHLTENGCKEIMLLGQNVNSYSGGISFEELLRRINDISGDFRVRFMSPHPKDVTHGLIDVIAGCEKICTHIHFPLQSGSSRILRAMNRRYTAEEYLEKVYHARSVIPDLSITTDIIVGFPNETEEDFEMTLDIMRKVKFDNIYSFIYSKRNGTKAALIDDKTSDEEKGKRFRRMLELQREISTEYYRRFIGKDFRVLFDGESRKDGMISGKSDEFIITEVKGGRELIGKFCDVKVTAAHNWAVEGEIIVH